MTRLAPSLEHTITYSGIHVQVKVCACTCVYVHHAPVTTLCMTLFIVVKGNKYIVMDMTVNWHCGRACL